MNWLRRIRFRWPWYVTREPDLPAFIPEIWRQELREGSVFIRHINDRSSSPNENTTNP